MRKDTHAGSWYSDNEVELTEEIRECIGDLSEATLKRVKYIISPHAGYAYCLKTAAYAYKIIDTSTIKTVFILGPSHYLALRGCGVDTFKALNTPLGPLHVDTDIVESLRKKDGFASIRKYDSEKEHSMEMQFPLLKFILKRASTEGVKVVPIMVGPLDGDYLDMAGHALVPYFQRQDTVFIVSSDFCHFGHRFGFTHTGYEGDGIQLWEAIEKLDLAGVEHIVKHDLKGYKRYLRETENTICGRYPIELLLKLIGLSEMCLDSEMLAYSQSGKCMRLHESSVSYCSIAGYVTDKM
ncbi:hypothetical protein BgAZ_303590 [Babesia gibsoni]|uniref:Memo-like protein n=1 Tax=Babesia gibsoni TaxID=33632 RepID=A0AAD8LQ64_BABGI|nr:hypothetical protein BgAZ_303590 [Babesia gibsoni]